jgi:hypothetical protein
MKGKCMKTLCPSCNATVDPSTQSACPTCGFQLKSATVPQNTIAPIAKRLKIPVELEVAMTTDRTGSSKQFEQGIRGMYEMILKPVVTRVKSVKVWHQLHGDMDCGQDMVLLTNGGDIQQAFEDSKRIVFEGGGDPPEHHLDAFENLLRTVPWTADSRRSRGVILGFCTADSKPARSGITAAQLGAEMKSQNILLYLVGEPFPWAQEMVQAAEGLLFPISNSPDPAELQKISGVIAASIPQASRPSATVPMTAPQPALAGVP